VPVSAEVDVTRRGRPANLRDEFAIIGDLPYNAQEEAKLPELIAATDRAKVAFVVHNGDFKSGATPCTDELFYERYKLFQTFKHPLLYVFGDNEWTDCHRSGSDPRERLAKLRDIFTQGHISLGHDPLQLTRQSDNPRYRKFRENVRWSVGGVLFVGLNIPGSNNNFPTTRPSGVTVGNLEEYTERNTANLAWMRESFAIATQGGSSGLMLFLQGNPIVLPIKTRSPGTEYTVADAEGGQPCSDAHGRPKPRP
jgi:hypothetical protein